jgi:hypothetical protein
MAPAGERPLPFRPAVRRSLPLRPLRPIGRRLAVAARTLIAITHVVVSPTVSTGRSVVDNRAAFFSAAGSGSISVR